MTSESAQLTEPWVKKHGAEYAYCYDKTNKLFGAVGGTGLPHAVLVDPGGTIGWIGHPASLDEATVRGALDGALKKPLWEWPKEAEQVKKAVVKQQLGKALAEAGKLGEEHADIRTALETLIAGKLDSLKAAQTAGDWLRVQDLGQELQSSFAGLPQEAEVEAILKALDQDEQAQEILDLQLKIQKMFEGRIKKATFDKYERELKEIKAEHPGTAAARDAEQALERLRELRAK